ncbi:UNVERIFIED_ORG: alcohol dehydrogenase class IV [Pseudomonas reinekei]|nr:alcohol dehydrogenase class IV [Pseudomonas reinekei]
MNLTGNWNYPTSIRFGVGRIAELADVCRSQGIERPLLVTDSGLARAPITTAALDALRAAGLGVALFCDLKPNPVEANLAGGLEAWRAGKHDGVIAFGGGSGLDMGKLIAFMSGQTRPVWDFEDIGDYWTRADDSRIAPVIAVPTTAGTGSEVGRAAVIIDERTHTKRIIFHPKMMPRVVISDPALTVGMPAKVTAGTGMDALSHCLEAYCAPGFHPLADGIAVEGMRLVANALVKAVHTPSDLEGARTNARGGGHGRHGIPERPGRDACALASGGCAVRHPSRHDQRHLHALCPAIQSPGHRGAHHPPGGVPAPALTGVRQLPCLRPEVAQGHRRAPYPG